MPQEPPVRAIRGVWTRMEHAADMANHGSMVLGCVNRYPGNTKIMDFVDLDQIQDFTESVDFMTSAHLGINLDPIWA